MNKKRDRQSKKHDIKKYNLNKNYIICLHNSNLNNNIKKIMEKYIVEDKKVFNFKKREIAFLKRTLK